MSNDVELKLISSVPDEDVASDILEKISTEGIISWRELVDMYRGKGILLYRLRKILLILLHERRIIELPCRLSRPPSTSRRHPRTRLGKRWPVR